MRNDNGYRPAPPIPGQWWPRRASSGGRPRQFRRYPHATEARRETAGLRLKKVACSAGRALRRVCASASHSWSSLVSRIDPALRLPLVHQEPDGEGHRRRRIRNPATQRARSTRRSCRPPTQPHAVEQEATEGLTTEQASAPDRPETSLFGVGPGTGALTSEYVLPAATCERWHADVTGRRRPSPSDRLSDGLARVALQAGELLGVEPGALPLAGKEIFCFLQLVVGPCLPAEGSSPRAGALRRRSTRGTGWIRLIARETALS